MQSSNVRLGAVGVLCVVMGGSVSSEATRPPMSAVCIPAITLSSSVPTITASGVFGQHVPENAFDGICSGPLAGPSRWIQQGFPPGWISVDFGTPKVISSISAVTEQSPSGFTVHNVYLDGELAFSWSGFTDTFRLLNHRFSIPVSAQVVTIETVTSPSWVAWRDILIKFDDGTAFPTGFNSCFCQFGIESCAPEEAIVELIALVQSLGLPHGIEISLVVKLDHALDALEPEHPAQNAMIHLQAFINQVDAPGGPVPHANLLIGIASGIIVALEE